MLDRFGTHEPLAELAARTMLHKAGSLSALGRDDPAVALYDRIVGFCRTHAPYYTAGDEGLMCERWRWNELAGEAVAARQRLTPGVEL